MSSSTEVQPLYAPLYGTLTYGVDLQANLSLRRHAEVVWLFILVHSPDTSLAFKFIRIGPILIWYNYYSPNASDILITLL